MKDYKDAKLISEDCMVRREFKGISGGGKWLQKRVGGIVILGTHGKVALDREEIVNLKLFLEETLKEEF